MKEAGKKLKEATEAAKKATVAAEAATKAATGNGTGATQSTIDALLKLRREGIMDDIPDDGSDSPPWTDSDEGGGGGASDDEDEGADDVFEPALRRLLISMLLKNRRLSAADCVRRICACDFSGCQFPCLREQQLVRGFVQYPFYRDAVHHAVHRLHPLLKPRF